MSQKCKNDKTCNGIICTIPIAWRIASEKLQWCDSHLDTSLSGACCLLKRLLKVYDVLGWKTTFHSITGLWKKISLSNSIRNEHASRLKPLKRRDFSIEMRCYARFEKLSVTSRNRVKVQILRLHWFDTDWVISGVCRFPQQRIHDPYTETVQDEKRHYQHLDRIHLLKIYYINDAQALQYIHPNIAPLNILHK